MWSLKKKTVESKREKYGVQNFKKRCGVKSKLKYKHAFNKATTLRVQKSL